jgi:reactive intermediate/imine deaminase
VQYVNTTEAPAAIGPYSQAIVSNGFVFTSGQIALDPITGDIPEGIEAQTELLLNNLKAVLEAAGSSAYKVIKTTCFLADMNDFASFNTVYEQHLPGKPARSCVAVKTLPKGVLVEVDAIAALIV